MVSKCYATLNWMCLLTTSFVSLVNEALITHHFSFRGSSTTYHQVLPFGESPLASATSEADGTASARTPSIESRTRVTHAESRAVNLNLNLNFNLAACRTSLAPVLGVVEVAVDDRR